MIPVELSLCPYRDIMPVIFFPCRDVMKNSTVIMSLQGKQEKNSLETIGEIN